MVLNYPSLCSSFNRFPLQPVQNAPYFTHKQHKFRLLFCVHALLRGHEHSHSIANERSHDCFTLAVIREDLSIVTDAAASEDHGIIVKFDSLATAIDHLFCSPKVAIIVGVILQEVSKYAAVRSDNSGNSHWKWREIFHSPSSASYTYISQQRWCRSKTLQESILVNIHRYSYQEEYHCCPSTISFSITQRKNHQWVTRDWLVHWHTIHTNM